MTCCVYRLYDGNGDLMYIGMSQNFLGRLSQHRVTQPWRSYIDTFRVREYPDRVTALRVEDRAIQILRPHENKTCKRPARERFIRPFRDYDQALEDARHCDHSWATLHRSKLKKCLKCGIRERELCHLQNLEKEQSDG